MATGTVIFTPGSAVLPDGSTSNLAPAIQRLKSSGTAPAVYALQLAFDAAADEWCTWTFRLPIDFASSPVAKVQFKMTSAVTGNVVWDVRIGTITPGSTTSANTKVFAAANTVTTAVPATTAGKIAESALTLTNFDSAVAGDWSVIRLSRVGSSGSDTAAGDAEFVMLVLEYTTT
jgi:hypothetical protein